MPGILAVHGIGNQYSGEHQICSDWLPALKDGLARAGSSLNDESQFSCAYYGDLFRPAGKALDPFYSSSDLADNWEKELLAAWWQEVRQVEPKFARPENGRKGIGLAALQAALHGLSQSSFFAGLAESLLIGDLKQVRRYLYEPNLRAAVRQRVADRLGPDTTVVIGHSLGSIVAYEALFAAPTHPPRTLITLGSPLGVSNLIFEKLQPPPIAGLGRWPTGVQRWVNIASPDDVVALVKNLQSRFGPALIDKWVDNGALAHDARHYLCTKELGDAVARGLSAH